MLGLFGLLAIAELCLPNGSQPRSAPGDERLFTNFGLTGLVLLAGGLFPLARMSSSIVSDRYGLGLSHVLYLPWAAILVATLLLDSFVSYWVHRLMHATPLLWRVHRVHHSDSAVDVSTSLRNHPLELLLTAPASALVVVALGAPPSAVIATQTVFVAAVLWEHAAVRLPDRLERALSIAIVTPALHRLHHSRQRELHDSNFGDSLVLWDWLFGTLRRNSLSPEVGLDGQRAMSDHLFQQILSPLHPA